MIPIAYAGTDSEERVLNAIKQRGISSDREIRAAVSSILDDIIEHGYEAVERISLQRDGHKPREVPRCEWEAALERCDPVLVEDLRLSVRNIKDYQEKLLPKMGFWQNPDGGEVGQLVNPVERVAIYVPGGTAAYPSSVMMTAVPAAVAGVNEIIMFTPPGDYLRDEVLAAALLSGVTSLFALGGIPAIACAAYGLGPVPKCDKIIGPGGAYITEAKRQVFGKVGIDSLAGPSDILVLCDSSARPDWVAADLLGQAEHDILAGAVLVTTDESLAHEVIKSLEVQLESLPRKEIAEKSLKDFGACFVCSSLEQAIGLVNHIAPEHLEIIMENPKQYLPQIRNAGAVFLGEWSPEPLGDYRAGPSHVLPTNGASRFFPALSVDAFIKKSSVINYDRRSLEKCTKSIARLARCEELEAHARSVEIRFSNREVE